MSAIPRTASTVVTCHANADHDAFASLLAAGLLHPDAALLFPGTQERRLMGIVREAIRNGRHNLCEPADLDLSQTRTLVVVDTRRPDRLRHVAPLLERKDVHVIVWDHHPDAPGDIRSDERHVRNTGSCAALLVEGLRAMDADPGPERATLIGLGIYGDTGSFTYSSVTETDFHAASWLLSRGMDVDRINELAAHELTSLQVRALNDLLESASVRVVDGEQVMLAEVSLESYLGDFACLAHQLMEMEKIDVLFALGRMNDRIQVVARARGSALDVGAVCAALGGGGHAYAASAAVRDRTIAEVRDAIIRAIHAQSSGSRRARDYMSSPAIGLESGRSIAEADELMLHFGIKTVPVFAPGTRTCIGVLDAQIAARAAGHGLGAKTVDDYMRRDIRILSPDAELAEISSVIVDGHQRLAPVMENDVTLGVISRTDLIGIFADNPDGIRTPGERRAKEQNLGKLMRDRLPPGTLRILETAGELARERGMRVYAVGGFVRDLLLNRANQDIDLVVEGDGPALARALAEAMGGRVRENPRFLTALAILNENGRERRVDVASARLEYYEKPAALPTVEGSSIRMDLFRRDFTMNALALRLDTTPFGRLEDFFGGRRDIKDGVIRVLHTLSFVEDPTRCLRAARFAVRYGFRISAQAERLIRNALSLGLFGRLPPSRLHHEFAAVCEEPAAAACLQRLDDMGILAALNPLLALTPERRSLIRSLGEILSWLRMSWFEEKADAAAVFFLALCRGCNFRDASACHEALGMPEARRKELLRGREAMRAAEAALARRRRDFDEGRVRAGELEDMLGETPLEGILLIMAGTDEHSGLRMALSRHIGEWRRARADIGGDDLRRMGLAPGPRIGEILRAVRRAKIDEVAVTRDEQLALAARLLEG